MRQAAFEAFLVEDVILTLANLRASLAWLGETAAADRGGATDTGGAADDAARRRAGLDRIDRQIGMLEDRARAVCDGLRQECDSAAVVLAAPAGPGRDDVSAWLRDGAAEQAVVRAAPEAAADTGPLTIAEAIRDALGEGAAEDEGAAVPAAAAPIFRSRRAG